MKRSKSECQNPKSEQNPKPEIRTVGWLAIFTAIGLRHDGKLLWEINPYDPRHPQLNQLLQPRVLTEFADQFLDLLRLAFVRQQHCVVGLHQN